MISTHTLVVLTRTVAGNQVWNEYLTSRGVYTYQFPTIETVALPITTSAINGIKQLTGTDWLIVTSAASVRYLTALLASESIDLSSLGVRIAAVGLQTAAALEAVSLHVSFVPSESSSEMALGRELPLINGMRVLLPQAVIASPNLQELLRLRGACVTRLPLYETRSICTLDKHFSKLIRQNLITYLTFASPSSVKGFWQCLQEESIQKTFRIPAIAIGSKTASELESVGFTRIHIARTPSVEGIFEIIRNLSE